MRRFGTFVAFLTLLVACAAPSPTVTPTQPPAAAATATMAPTAAPTKRPLIKTTLTQSAENMDYLAVAAVDRLGYFRDEGQDLERVVTGKGDVANAAVIGGSAQFVASTASEPINAAAQEDKKLVIVQALVTEITNNVIIRKDVADRLGITEKSPLETRVKALKGLRIGIVSTGGFGNTLIRYTLRMANLNPERDVEITAVGDAGAHVAALRQGTIDVMLRAPPANSIPVAEGWAVTLVNYQAGEVKELSGI
ncbi:MAG: ABC transporter substrate-binding protein, partial [Chloroflexi bacterium]|nr:ABC transporter substrate-binding protein [Chloroflexota bacterium]